MLEGIGYSVYSLLCWGIVSTVAAGLGFKVIGWFGWNFRSLLERGVFGLAIGLGILGYGVFVLGLAGWMKPWGVVILVGGVGVICWKESLGVWQQLYRSHFWKKQRGGGLGVEAKLVVFLGGGMFLLSLLLALAPPTAVDALIYHLEAPKRFLEAGRILAMPENSQANYPLTVQMLFAIGLALDSDVFAQLVTLGFALLLAGATWSFGSHFLRPRGRWEAVAILIGIPIFSIWASIPYVDIAWGLYEFLGMYALIYWVKRGENRWLVLSALLTGLALGSKYLAIFGLLAQGAWVLWQSCKHGWRKVFVNGLTFGGIALAIASPWYVKNWLWLGNPVYPFLFGGASWEVNHLEGLMAEIRLFSIWDYVLLLLNVYLKHERYASFMASIALPSPLYPLALLYPFVRQDRRMDKLAGLAVLRVLAWVLYPDTRIRYMLPFFPGLSLLTAYVLVNALRSLRVQSLSRLVVNGLVGGMLASGLLYASLYFVDVNPLPVLVGMEERQSFLHRRLKDYEGIQYVESELPANVKVMMLWDGRGYYCDQRCMPDADQTHWVRVVLSSSGVEQAADRLHAMGVTHLFLSLEDADYMLQNDPQGVHRQAAEFFLHQFQPACTDEIYRDEGVRIYELTCE
ncbi:MAG: hypothetical protein AB1345_09520 [Chloroflexota bacterium]